MKTEILTTCAQFVAGAANGIYQGIIIAAAVALGLRLLDRTNATTRHAVWFCTLLLLVSVIVAHCLMGPPSFTPPAAKANDMATVLGTETDLPTTIAAAVADTVAARDSSSPVTFHDYQTRGPMEQLEPRDDSPLLPSIEVAAIEAQDHPVGHRLAENAEPSGNEIGGVPSADEPLAGSVVSGEAISLRWLLERLVNPIPINLAPGSNVLSIASMIFLVLWLTIGGGRVLVLLFQLSRIQKLKRCSFPPSAELNDHFQMLAARLAVNRKVELKVSPTLRSSFLLGFLHPVILLPAEEKMEPGEAELVVRHELAHVQRHDDWANLVQQFALAVFFFHPAVWWISKQLSLEREIACDDHVLQQSRRPQAYAFLLASLAARMQRELPLLAPGSSNHKTQLKQRIDMILNKHRNTSPRLAKTWLAVITSAAALFAVAIISSAPRIVLAQNETVPGPAKAPSAGIASVAFTAAPSDSDSADNISSATTAPAAVGTGPKFKPGARNVSPAVVAAPAAPSLPGAAHAVGVPPAPALPFLAAAAPAPEPRALRSPRPVRAPRPGSDDSSLEERLERLERLVESLANLQNPKGRVDFHLKAEKDGMIDRKEIAKIEAFAKHQAEVARTHVIGPKEIEKIKEQAEREAGRAIEQAKRATLEADKALKGERKLHTTRKLKDGSEKQLEALRKQLEMLERQRDELDHQIERLEQEQEQLDEQSDEDEARSDTQTEESEAELVVEQPVRQ